jgi:hypothetical protein
MQATVHRKDAKDIIESQERFEDRLYRGMMSFLLVPAES